MSWLREKREKAKCMILAVQLMWRCWRISRRFDMPFDVVLEMHIRGLQMVLDQQLLEWKRATAAQQAPNN